jgi:hypothetical protein
VKIFIQMTAPHAVVGVPYFAGSIVNSEALVVAYKIMPQSKLTWFGEGTSAECLSVGKH